MSKEDSRTTSLCKYYKSLFGVPDMTILKTWSTAGVFGLPEPGIEPGTFRSSV